MNSFVNLVDDQIVVNGIVNSVKNGNFYNGKAVFISPNGMVVGSSGVLNVGSLGTYTMSKTTFDTLTNSSNKALLEQQLEHLENGKISVQGQTGKFLRSNSPLIIDGKIITSGDAKLETYGAINVGKNGGIAAGVNESQRAVYSSSDAANQLFNKLVNTDNVKTGSGDRFAASNGDIHVLATSGLTVDGDIVNYANNGNTYVANQSFIDSSNSLPYPSGNMVLSGSIINRNGNLKIENSAGDLKANEGSYIYNNGNTTIGNLPFTTAQNSPRANTNTGMYLNGTIDTKGDLGIQNTGEKGLNIGSTAKINHKGDLLVFNGYGQSKYGNPSQYDYGNNTGALNIDGDITVTNGDAKFVNTDRGVNGLNVNGKVNVSGESEYFNDGAAGLNVNGTAKSGGNLSMTNTGKNGLTINSPALVMSDKNVNLYNEGTGHKVSTFDNSGMNIQGLVRAGNDVNMTNKNSNVVIGDTTANKEYVTAGNDINIKVNDGSLLNYGVDKVLLVANGDLTMDVTNGTIGLPVQQEKCKDSGCTGIGVKADGSRDFKKSINGNIKGKVNATTTNTKAVTKPDDLVINYAAIDSDMNIDAIKADGRVILTVDDSGHASLKNLEWYITAVCCHEV